MKIPSFLQYTSQLQLYALRIWNELLFGLNYYLYSSFLISYIWTKHELFLNWLYVNKVKSSDNQAVYMYTVRIAPIYWTNCIYPLISCSRNRWFITNFGFGMVCKRKVKCKIEQNIQGHLQVNVSFIGYRLQLNKACA